jgi:folate-binding protein YgfZ
MPGTAVRVGRRPRGFVGVRGPDAASYLQAMVSNDVEALGPGESCEALLLTAKGRVVAPMTVELEQHDSVLVVGRESPPGAVANREFGVAAYELLDEETPAWGEIGDEELERLRIRAGTPRHGRELDERVLPAEAGLDRTAIDFAKGCYPGQEPVARQHYRGRVNRTLRVLEIEGGELPPYDAELEYDGKVVGRVTSTAKEGEHVIGLGYVRVEVPRAADLRLGDRIVRQPDGVGSHAAAHDLRRVT